MITPLFLICWSLGYLVAGRRQVEAARQLLDPLRPRGAAPSGVSTRSGARTARPGATKVAVSKPVPKRRRRTAVPAKVVAMDTEEPAVKEDSRLSRWFRRVFRRANSVDGAELETTPPTEFPASFSDGDSFGSVGDEGCVRKVGSWHKWPAGQTATYGASWCRADKLPAHQRAPQHIQGLYAMIGLPMPDAFVCLSTGLWNASERSLVVHLATDFVWSNTPPGYGMAMQAKVDSSFYKLTFSRNLRKVKIQIGSSNTGMRGAFDRRRYELFNRFTHFPMTEDRDNGRARGEKWHRPSFLRMPGQSNHSQVNYYYLLKVMDGSLGESKKNMEFVLSTKGLRMKGVNGLGNFQITCNDARAY